MLRNIVLRIVLVAALALSFTIPATAANAAPTAPGMQLVLIAAVAPEDMGRLAATGAGVFARFNGANGRYLLAGVDAAQAAALAAAGFSYRVLDAQPQGRDYYLVYAAPGQPLGPLPDAAPILYRDSRVALVQSEPPAMEQAAATGAEIVRVTLEPKPLTGAAIGAFPLVAAPDPVVRWMVDQVEQDTVRQYDGDLSGEWPVTIRGSAYQIKTRNTNSRTPIQQATYYVGDHLRALGLTVEEHVWGSAFAPNIVGQKTGATRPGDIFMVTAHLDDMPTGATAPGADDNASGSTAVLVAADILAQFGWNCTLRFALWTGEEQGLLGSANYAQRAKTNGENILGVFNLDMIAWNTPNSAPEIDLHADAALPATVNLANQAASVVSAYNLDLIPEVRADGTGASDHASFWDQMYPAILGIEDYYPDDHDFDPYYHKTSDTLATLDLDYFTEYVKLAVAETAHMAGCLTTGGLQGAVLASHDGSRIAAAEIGLTDAAGRAYALGADSTGGYSQSVPPGSYAASVSAYGYETGAWSGITASANVTSTRDFTLVAAAPAAPAPTISVDAGEAKLSWPHLSPNTAYRVYRDVAPYFTPAGLPLASLDAAHAPAPGEQIEYRDGASGVGDAATNHFYVVLGVNAAGAGAASARRGEFDFALTR